MSILYSPILKLSSHLLVNVKFKKGLKVDVTLSKALQHCRSADLFCPGNKDDLEENEPVRTASYTCADRTTIGHEIKIRCIASITIWEGY